MKPINILVLICIISTIASNAFGDGTALEVINGTPYNLSLSHIGWLHKEPLGFGYTTDQPDINDPIIKANTRKTCWWAPRDISRGSMLRDKLQITIMPDGKKIIIPIENDGSIFTITEKSPGSQDLELEITKDFLDRFYKAYNCYCMPGCDPTS